jgi:hypothetical protein
MKRRTKAISGNLKIIHRYRTAQALLLKGCTVDDLVEALSLSDKSVRRLIDDFIADGCKVESTFVRGMQDAAVFWLVGRKRLV